MLGVHRGGGEAHDSGDMEGVRASLIVSVCVLGDDLSEVVNAVDGDLCVLGEYVADQSHKLGGVLDAGLALERHRSIAVNIPHGSVVEKSRDQAVGSALGRRLYSERAAGLEDEVLNNGSRTDHSEQSECASGLGHLADSLEVTDLVALTVEPACEHRTSHCQLVADNGESGVTDRSPILYGRHINIIQQVDSSRRVLPFLKGRAGVDSGGELHEIISGRYALCQNLTRELVA